LIPSQLSATQQVIPSLSRDSRNRLVAVVISSAIIGVCMKRLGSEPLTADTYRDRLKTESWATLVRKHDGVYFITVCGLIPPDKEVDPSLIAKPDNAEAVHMAIEIGLAAWPEWGASLRGHYRPKMTLPVQLSEEDIVA
jgi:hypothetical protein